MEPNLKETCEPNTNYVVALYNVFSGELVLGRLAFGLKLLQLRNHQVDGFSLYLFCQKHVIEDNF